MLFAEVNLFVLISNATYLALAAVALWGLYCIVIVWTRVSQKRFKNETAQDEFLDEVEPSLRAGKFDNVEEVCDGDDRAVPQMSGLALANRELGYGRVRQVMLDRFQRDVLS